MPTMGQRGADISGRFGVGRRMRCRVEAVLSTRGGTMPIVTVDLGSRAYPIHIGTGLLAGLGERLREHGLRQKEALVITNSQVAGLYFEGVRESLAGAGFARVLKHEIPA